METARCDRGDFQWDCKPAWGKSGTFCLQKLKLRDAKKYAIIYNKL